MFSSEKALEVLASTKIVSSLEKYLVWATSRARQCRYGWGALGDPSGTRHKGGRNISRHWHEKVGDSTQLESCVPDKEGLQPLGA